jgi:23S rRNA (adenine2503-C2)-methyltransferase
MDAVQKQCLVGMTLDEITGATKDLSLPSYLPREIAIWVYKRGAVSIDHFTNISKKHRQELNERFEVGLSPYVKVSTSTDGTRKYLYKALANRYIESAYIPDIKRHTLCISSQVGCKLGCLFCMTGKQGFQGHLTSNQILNQILSLPERRLLTNLVFMGMGEPFDNIEITLKTLEILTAEWGLSFSPRKITVSTIGIIPGMKRFLEETKCQLAISMHSPFENERAMLMPAENVYPIRKIVEILKAFPINKRRNVSFEYILFKGLNDSPRHINQLARLLNGLKCKINLMRFHPIPESPLMGTDDKALIDFRDRLNAKGITATIRASRGEDILAACGLLSTKEINKNMSK